MTRIESNAWVFSTLFVAVAVAIATAGCGGAHPTRDDRSRAEEQSAERPVQIAAPDVSLRRPRAIPDGAAPEPIEAPAAPIEPAPEPEPVIEPEPTAAGRQAMLDELYDSPRHLPELLEQPPRKSRIQPGEYRCRIDEGYKLRNCRVEKDPTGHVMLEVESGNLIEMRGVLQNRGPNVRFEGWLTERRPFGCISCQERCFVTPGSCHCIPLAFEATRECLAQPLIIDFKGSGGTWKGRLEYKTYYNRYDHGTEPPTPIGFQTERNIFEVLLKRK